MQVQSNYTKDNTFFKEKMSCPRWDSNGDTLQSRQSALPTELAGQTSRQGPKSAIQHNTKARKTSNHSMHETIVCSTPALERHW